MRRFYRAFVLGAVLTGVSLLAPVTRPVDAQDAAARAVIAPGLERQLQSTGPDELVSAVVRLRPLGPAPQAGSGRAAVFTALRNRSRVSQEGLLRFLDQPSIRSQRGVVRSFWIDNLVLVQARRNVIEQIARRPDVIEVFDNFTMNLPPRPVDDPEPQNHQAQPWDNIAHIGAEQVWSSYGLTGTGIRVGGLDTGVDIAHPDLAGKMVTTNPADPTYPGGWAEFDANGNIIPGWAPRRSESRSHTTGTMIGGSASRADRCRGAPTRG